MAQLTTAEAAHLLGIAEAALHEWCTRNEGPAYTKTGRLIRYPDYEIERWIRERTIKTSVGAGIREKNENFKMWRRENGIHDNTLRKTTGSCWISSSSIPEDRGGPIMTHLHEVMTTKSRFRPNKTAA